MTETDGRLSGDEEGKEEQRREREEAKAEWQALRQEIANHGGIKVPARLREDYRDLPSGVRATHGFEIDNMANVFGFDNGDDFIRYVKSTRDRAARADTTKLARPKRPEFEREPRRAFVRHQDPKIRAMLDEYRETKAILRDGEKELGKGHPALKDLQDVLREQRTEYLDAARAAGERPAAA